MPRKPRSRSQSGIYHVMLRAVNRQQIFCDEEDYEYYIKLLKKYKQVCSFQLYAYCLMGNHIHLLLKEGTEPLESIFKHLGSSFVYWYNSKYNRVGHLFQDRFRSEAVNDDTYFQIVLRYILRNPVQAGLCNTPESYRYSSCREYYYSDNGITDTEYVLKQMDRKVLMEFVSQNNEDKCMEVSEAQRSVLTDTSAKELILQVLGTLHPQTGKAKERQKLNESIKQLIHAGISIRQLSRLTGLSKKIIESGLKH